MSNSKVENISDAPKIDEDDFKKVKKFGPLIELMAKVLIQKDAAAIDENKSAEKKAENECGRKN